MIYVFHGLLVLILFAEVYLFELLGPMRQSEGLSAGLIMVCLPGLALMSPMQRPELKRNAIAFSLVCFALGGFLLGGIFLKNTLDEIPRSREALVFAPLQAASEALRQASYVDPTRAAAEPIVPINDRDYADRFPLPEALHPSMAEAVRHGIQHGGETLRKVEREPARYRTARETFENKLQREIGQKADLVIRTERARTLSQIMLAVATVGLVAGIVLIVLRLRARPDSSTPQPVADQ